MKTIFTFSLCLIYYISICQTFVINKHQNNTFQNHVRKLQKNPNNLRLIESVEKQIENFYNSFNNDFHSELKSGNNINWIKNLNHFNIINEKLLLANSVLPNSLLITETLTKLSSIKQLIADSVYNYSTNLISYNERFKYIEANYLLSKLDLIFPDYKNINELIELTENSGIVNVFLKIENNSKIELNENLLQNIINIDSLNSVSKWIKYTFCENENSDYKILFTINDVIVTPENISTIKNRRLKFKHTSFYERSFYSLNNSYDKLFLRNNIYIPPHYHEKEDLLYYANKEAILSGNISINKSSELSYVNRNFFIKSIYNCKWNSKYGNLLKQNPEILPSNDEMIASVFKQFQNVIDKEKILCVY
ncbi:MAG: hypothetical protein A2033_19285 [Bacteroidetes bacterium GWA2_31_9]|nr:MAG: hypothetical protein A2033_19285 [Bacteroidetes bacterium GWA2_31_9]